jgi:hypothetical protein
MISPRQLDFCNAPWQVDLTRARAVPARFSCSFQATNGQINRAGKRKGTFDASESINVSGHGSSTDFGLPVVI